MLKILLKISILLLPISLNAQVQIETEVPNELEICGSHEQVELKLKNEGNAQEEDGFLTISIPSGFYVDENTVLGATISTNDGNGLIGLDLPLIEAGDTLMVFFDITAKVSTIAAQQNGDVFRITAEYESSVSSSSHLSEAMNVLFPALNILSLTPSSQTAVTGEEVQRSINIINAGYGKTDVIQVLLSDNAEGLMLTETDLGVLSAEQDMITLSSADFMGVGNGDGYLDSGETITIEQTLQLSGCTAQTITTAIKASWGCAEEEVETVNSYSNVTIALKLPNLVVSHEIDSTSCFIGDFDHNEILIENTGQGYAESVTVNIFKSTGDGIDDDIFNAIESSTVKYQINGGDWVVPSMTEISTRNDGEYACLGSSPVGSIDFTLAESLAPDDVVRVEFDMKKCCINDCLDQGNMGWSYSVNYEDACFTQSFTKEGNGEESFIQEEAGEKLCGTVYNDQNENCLFDEGEQPIPGIVIKELSSGLSVVSDQNGEFEYWSTNDQVTLTALLGDDYSSSCGSSITTNLSGIDVSCGLNFGIVSECLSSDLAVSLGHSDLRRGFTNQITLNYENHGTAPAEQIELRFDVSNSIHLVSASIPWDSEIQNEETRTYIWNLGELSGYEFNSIQVIDSVDVWSEIEEIVTMSLLISSDGEECNLADNTFSVSDVIVGSVDPNDKHVTSSNNNFYQVTSDDWLHYKIRFQNVGNYYATRIVVIDTLSEFLGQSHDLPITINENVITWSSNSTFLPDSISDEPGSHGYMNFRIRPKTGEELKGLISNKVHIQFDFNEYIVTNTVHKNLVNSMNAENLEMMIHPNPSSGSSLVSVMSKSLTEKEFAQIYSLEILDSQGSVIKRIFAMDPYVMALEEYGLVSGMYLLKATLVNGNIVIGKWLLTEKNH